MTDVKEVLNTVREEEDLIGRIPEEAVQEHLLRAINLLLP